jgi:SAM-dependent methyltransferase
VASGFGADDVSASYDRVAQDCAAEFADELTRKAFDRELLDDFALLTGDRGVVCDLGCGPGHVARYLADRGVQVLGVDLSEVMVAIARQANPGLVFVHGDARCLRVDDGALAAIVAFYSLIHLRREELGEVLGELRRALAPAGLLLLAVHGGTGTTHLDELFGAQVDLSVTLFDRDELSRELEAAGFTVDQAVQRPPYDFELQTPRVYVLARRT